MRGKATSTEDRARLARLQATGLFGGIDDAFLDAMADEVESSSALADVIDLYADYRKDDPELLLRSPQSLEPVRALGLSEVLRAEGHTLHLRGERTRFECVTHHDFVRAFNAGLEALGDARRFVALVTRDWEEPLFILATVEQRLVLVEARVINSHAS